MAGKIEQFYFEIAIKKNKLTSNTMTEEQKSSLIYALYQSKKTDISELSDSLLNQFTIPSDEALAVKQSILEEFNNGVRHLNSNQFDNLMKMALEKSYLENEIINKLNFYEIDKESHQNILSFLQGFKKAHKAVNVDKIDLDFKGVQVATYDDFGEILQLGYTGDWVIVPKNVQPLRIQIASMKETGSYTRGFYINADIEKMEPIEYEGKTRYRIFITNPVIVNSGNRNIKFSNNPVRYIK